MNGKNIIFFGTTTTAATHTLGETTGTGLQEAKTMFSRCNVLFNVGTFTGGGSIVASFQERFSNAGFVETASTTITATGSYFLLRDADSNALASSSGASAQSRMHGGFAALGNGTDKQVVFTVSSMSTFGVNSYLIFFQI